jgi:hypothetical protein
MTGPPRQTTAPCAVHRYHTPTSHINEVHHIWPVGDGGPDIPANKVTICATGHNSVHHLLDAYRRAGGDPGWPQRRQYTPGERQLADLGWRRLSAQSMEP